MEGRKEGQKVRRMEGRIGNKKGKKKRTERMEEQ